MTAIIADNYFDKFIIACTKEIHDTVLHCLSLPGDVELIVHKDLFLDRPLGTIIGKNKANSEYLDVQVKENDRKLPAVTFVEHPVPGNTVHACNTCVMTIKDYEKEKDSIKNFIPVVVTNTIWSLHTFCLSTKSKHCNIYFYAHNVSFYKEQDETYTLKFGFTTMLFY